MADHPPDPAAEGGTAGLYDPDRVIRPTPTPQPDSIIGGQATRDFPDCCALGDATEYFCSGTLIAPTVVVSAEHCLDIDRVFVGGWDVADPGGGTVLQVARQEAREDVDLRVLVLKDPAPKAIEPRHVAQGLEAKGEKAVLVGFGTIDFEGTVGFGVKRKVEVPIKSLDCGSDEAAATYGCLPGQELVAGHRGLDRDTCLGDSGGPLYVLGQQGYYLLGVTSRGVKGTGRDCGDGGVYVRVDRFVDWIREVARVEIPGPL